MFSVVIFNQSLETLTYLNDQTSRNLTYLMKLTELLRNFGLKLALLNWSENFPLKESLRLNRLDIYSLRTSLAICLGIKQLVRIYHLTSLLFILSCLVRCINEDLVKSEFPDPLKLSNIVPVYTKMWILLIKKFQAC